MCIQNDFGFEVGKMENVNECEDCNQSYFKLTFIHAKLFAESSDLLEELFSESNISATGNNFWFFPNRFRQKVTNIFLKRRWWNLENQARKQLIVFNEFICFVFWQTRIHDSRKFWWTFHYFSCLQFSTRYIPGWRKKLWHANDKIIKRIKAWCEFSQVAQLSLAQSHILPDIQKEIERPLPMLIVRWLV